MLNIVIIILSYLTGSIPSGVIVARIMGGTDPRAEGSGNIGATNVLRTLGAKAAVATLSGDILKGILPVLLAMILLPAGSATLYLVAGAAIIGHDFSIFLRFSGGKGVATTLGSLLALSPSVAGLSIAVWICTVIITRYSSAGALVSALISPVFALVLTGNPALAVFCAIAAALLIFKHRDNIDRMIKGDEKRVSFKASSEA